VGGKSGGAFFFSFQFDFFALKKTHFLFGKKKQVPGCNTTAAGVDRSKCVLDAEQLPPAGPLFCARLMSNSAKLPKNFKKEVLPICATLAYVVNKIANNTYVQQEYAGAEYSWGNAGEGVRLLLGSDVTTRPVIVAGKATQTKTEWLVPASPVGFFPGQCDLLQDYDCALKGNHDEPFSNFRNDIYPLGYRATLWKPAGPEVWLLGLRGNQPVAANASGDAISLLSIMEKGNEWDGAVPFKNIRDRLWVSRTERLTEREKNAGGGGEKKKCERRDREKKMREEGEKELSAASSHLLLPASHAAPPSPLPSLFSSSNNNSGSTTRRRKLAWRTWDITA